MITKQGRKVVVRKCLKEYVMGRLKEAVDKEFSPQKIKEMKIGDDFSIRVNYEVTII